MIILLNILIALYNSAYSDIYENADDEYLALFAQKTMQFVRAPDENVYIAPLNLVEMVVSALTEWWMPKKTYELVNDWVMGAIYSPLLFVAAFFETRTAHAIRSNRARGEEDDDQEHDWEQLVGQLDLEAEGWTKTCETVKPNVEEEPAVIEVRKLRTEVEALKSMLSDISKAMVLQAEHTEEALKSKSGVPNLFPEGTGLTLKEDEDKSSKASPEEGGKALQEDVPETEAPKDVPETEAPEDVPETEAPEDVLETEASDVPETPGTEAPESSAPETSEAQDAPEGGSKSKKKKNKKKSKGGAGGGGSSGAGGSGA
jgi:uncharacterized membrane protein YgcG